MTFIIVSFLGWSAAGTALATLHSRTVREDAHERTVDRLHGLRKQYLERNRS